MKTKTLVLTAIISLGMVFQGCEKDDISKEQQYIALEKETSKKNISNDKVCPGCSPGTFKCELKCRGGGFSIKVHEHPDGDVVYTYSPKKYIYVDQTYHNSIWATHTSNSYTFDMFIINNTNSSSSSNWKDEDGNVIVGNVYRYKIKPGLLPCDQVFFTNKLSLGSGIDPCDMNVALNSLNSSSYKPNACNQGAYSSGIFCPVEPSITYKSIDFVPYEGPKIYYYFGKDCKTSNPGYCGPDTTTVEVPATIDPNIGPVFFDFIEEQNAFKLNFMRDLKSSTLVIDRPSEVVLTQEVIDHFELSNGAELEYGNYPVIPTEDDFGYSIIPLNN